MELQKQEIEEFRALYKRASGKDVSFKDAAYMAQEFLQLMKVLTDDYESYINISPGEGF